MPYEDFESVGGSRIYDEGPAPRRRPNGRICREPDCGTILSIYNDGDFCAMHEPRAAIRTRGKRATEAA